MTDFIATLVVTFEDSWRWIAFLLIVLAIVWIVSLMRDPDKLMGLIPQLFSTIWKVLHFTGIALYEVSKFLFTVISRVLTVTFATIRDFFISRN